MSTDPDDLLVLDYVGPRWPQPGDSLFKAPEPSFHSSAVLGWLTYKDWEVYVLGYKHAADVLVDSLAGSTANLDSLVYPIVFLYRHYIELRLKTLVHDAERLLDNEVAFPGGHRIEELWSRFKPLLLQVWPEAPADALDASERLILEFAELDPSNDVFRYPADRKGQPHSSLPEGQWHLDVLHLSRSMGRLARFLDGASAGIDGLYDEQQEARAIEREMAPAPWEY